MAYYEYEFPQQKIFEVKDLPSINNSNNLYIDSEKPLQKNRPKIKPQKVVFLFFDNDWKRSDQSLNN